MAEVDLTNCDREPIHIPGTVQPHGVLLSFDAAHGLAAHSANAAEVLGSVPALGSTLASGSFPPPIVQALVQLLRPDLDQDTLEIELNGRVFDVQGHRSGDFWIVELEPRPVDSPPPHIFALAAQRALSDMHRASSLEALLIETTREIRRVTGFDRVMCYQFRHDQSGEVVTEERRGDLEPFLGLRYPASDIPVQARRLYEVNLLRFIADVDAAPSRLVPPLGPDSSQPLDLSHSVLRSVSPIHIEYLRNMGVRASMSVSIIVEGRLWGLFACHHYSGPRVASPPVRAACKVMGQVTSVLVEKHVADRHRRALSSSQAVLARLNGGLHLGDDVLATALASNVVPDLIKCDGGAIALEGRVVRWGRAPRPEDIATILTRLAGEDVPEVVSMNRPEGALENLAIADCPCGMLAVRFHKESGGWVFWFRSEEIETVRWAGEPNKVYAEGPNGARLSPRGSFAEYIEVVRGRALPWTSVDLTLARQLKVVLQEAVLARGAEVQRARDVFMAALGHDLRNPLHAITLSAALLSADPSKAAKMGGRISTSADRMKRLVDQMLDFGRIQAGGIGVSRTDIDVVALARTIIDESESAFPGFQVRADFPAGGLRANVDPDRFGQVLANLLSNARHHGLPARPVDVVMARDGDDLVLEVANEAEEIPEARRANLFKPFKGEGASNPRNRTGLGLGLYIVQQIVIEHGGAVGLDYENGRVVLRVRLPGAARDPAPRDATV